MKKAILLLLMLPAMLMAAPVDPYLAQQVASNFINAPETSSNNAVLRAPRKLKRMARAPKQVTSDQQFYIFNSEDGEGFVIVSADDIAHPILGYSSTGSLDSRDMPENLRWWLSEYNRQVVWAKGNNITQSLEIADEWQQVISNNIIAATPVVSPLVQTIWGQAPYYNNKCPFNYLVMQRTVTGCAATALAQVMNYWQWPTIGDGFHQYNCAFYGTQSANFGATIYDWDYMPNELTPNSTSRQVDAVATLMYHCGVAMDMDYGLSTKYWKFNKGTGSATGADDVVTAAVNYFRYSATTENAKKQNYSETEWINLIKGQLDAHHPMVYWGIGNGGGHAFVCDGYDSQNMFHFNWGWGGDCNDAYYAVSALIPGPGGIGSGDSGDYTANQGAIINMIPRSTNNSANLQVNSNWYLSSDSIQYGGTIAASVSIKNYGSSTFVGDVVAMVLDKDGNYFADYTIQANCTIPKNGTLTLNPYVSGNAGLIPGKYYVALFYRNNDIGYQIIGSEYYVNLATFKVYYQAELETYSDFAIYSDDNHSLVKGKQAQVCVTLKNTGSTYFHGKAALVLYNSDLSQGEDFYEIDMGIAGISAGGTRTLTFTGTSHLDPGTYILALVYSDNNNNVHFAGSTYYSNPIYVVVKADGEEIVPSNPITIKAKMPSDWGTTISAWTWQDGSEGNWTSLEKEGEWYSYTSTTNPLNIIFVNGSTWNGDNNQTVDIRLTENSCLQIGNNTAGKRSYTVVDCPSEEFELKPGNYVIVANRDKDGDRKWYYMTSDLGTASTKRFQAVSTGTESMDAIDITDLEDKYVWTLEADGTNWKLKNGTQYVSWTSGNSAKLDATGKLLTFDVADNQVLAHFNDGTAERYLSLNATTNNNYFAFYSGTNQVEQLFFLPYDEGTTPPIESNRYIVLAQRNATSNWFYMTSDLGSASTKRYQAVDAGTSVLADVVNQNLADKYYWEIDGNKLHTVAGYSTWTSGNSANFDATGKDLTIQQQTDGTYTFSFVEGDNTRYLALNKTAGNDYFAYYIGTNQIYKLTLVKEGSSGTTTSIEGVIPAEQKATKILRNGQIYILRGEKVYTLTGQEVK
ncbi:MAG: C10 family peptidase [Paludibacteraceae bacterium]|nr:C10 family peptidase [Paludibacteraceae bacterium]